MDKLKCIVCDKKLSGRGKTNKCRSCVQLGNQRGKGKILTEEHKQIIREMRTGKNNHQWKGDDVGYSALHEWIRNRFEKPSLCMDCKQVPPIDLANISGEYKRDLSDWEWLCRKCHMIKDGRLEKLKQCSKRRKF